MTFIHPLLLGGLVLVGIPVLLHLIMHQTPKRLPFPAIRFLRQKQRSNSRRLLLRHLLLLLLRIGVIVLICLALARPRLAGSSLATAFSAGRPVNAVLLLDTSYSMEYTVAGKSWLDEARRRALELVDEMPEGSRVAVFDSSETGGEWSPSLSLARERIAGLRLRHGSAPLPLQIRNACSLFQNLEHEPDAPSEPLPKVLYIFSDRTRACWDEAAARSFQVPEDLSAVFVDVGADSTSNLAITSVQPERTTVRPGDRVRLNVTIQATGADYDTEVVCLLDGEASGQRLPVKLQAGQSRVFVFERPTAGRGSKGEGAKGLSEGLHQAEVRLASNDALPFDNAGFTTFRVLEGGRVLVLADDPKGDAREWELILAPVFGADVHASADSAGIDISRYRVICLVNVARPARELWERLKTFVVAGGGLAVVPGGYAWHPDLSAYSDDLARELLPGRLLSRSLPADDAHRFWYELERAPQQLSRHPLLLPFARWRGVGDVDFLTTEALKPRARLFWKVEPAEGQGTVLASYTDKDRSPALLERVVGQGRILLLTTPFDRRKDAGGKEPNNYFELSSFGFVLGNLVVGYLAGDTDEVNLNHVAGEALTLSLPSQPLFPKYTLLGPGISGSDADLPRQPEQKELRIAQAVVPGNYALLDGQGQRLTAFSMNPRPEECQLDRVPVEPIEALLGPESVLPMGRSVSLRERLQEHWAQPLEVAPSLLLVLLLVLALENLLANKFYKRPKEQTEQAVPTRVQPEPAMPVTSSS